MELKNLGQTAASALIHTDIRLEREHWTMFRNKLLGIAAAATLGSAAMLGSTAAYALKIADAAPGDRAALMAAESSYTYATETLLSTATTEVDGDSTMYYNIADTVVLSAPADVGANPGDSYLVSVTLDGMVFQSAASLAGAGTGSFRTVVGGAAGDDMVLFRLSSDGVIDASTAILTLTANYAVSAAGGSATLTMTNQTLADLGIDGVDGTEEHSGNVIKIAPALNEVSMAMNPTADVAADGFMQFLNERTTASLGTLMVGYKDTLYSATTGVAVAAMTELMSTGTSGIPAVPDSSVTFSGDFSFASKVFLHGDTDCGAATSDDHVDATNSDSDEASAETDIRMMDGDMVMGTTTALNVTAFTAAQYLCIMIDPEAEDAMRIPATSAYTAMGSYQKIANAAIGPMPMEQTLGMIERNGTTIRLPYLSTNDKFNQRIRIVNRGPEARYDMSFHGADDMAGADASGMLTANEITVLSLRTDDVVMPGNGNNTSGTLIVEAQPGMIDVATVQINRETGNSDTVVYD